MADLDGMDDVFDSRDVVERINEIALEYGPREGDSIDTLHLEDATDEEREEFDTLVSFRDSIHDVSGFDFGITFISDGYFRTYAQDLAEDIGAIDRDATWPLNRIDWDAAADDLLIDYSQVEFYGATYYYRA